MAAPPVVLRVRVKGVESFGYPVVTASSIAPPLVNAYWSFMPFPSGQGDIIWQGTRFGLAAPDSDTGLHPNIWQINVTIRHHCSDTADFSGVTGQVYDTNTSTVLASAPFTLSSTFVTDTVTLAAGYPQADISGLAARLVYHAVAPGLAYVDYAYADLSWSYSDSIGSVTAASTAVMAGPVLSVAVPPAVLVSAGTTVASLVPAFGQPTTAGDLLVAWVFSNSSSPSFDTATSAAGWQLAGHTGGSFGWQSMWYKLRCGAAETPPVFTTGATTPLSQLLEFSGVRALDQVGGLSGINALTVPAPAQDSASGDLVVAFASWAGTNPGPAAITMTGTDSSGAALPMSVQDNAATTGTQFWVSGWAQASAGIGPTVDTIATSVGVFTNGGGMLASFLTEAQPQALPPLLLPARRMAGRVVTVPVRIGGG